MASYYKKNHSMHLFHTDQCNAVPLSWFHAHLSVNIFQTTFEPLKIQEFLIYFQIMVILKSHKLPLSCNVWAAQKSYIF